jgi:hypothetical protein
MSYFEFLVVLIGLVGAIAVSEILVFWGYAIRRWGSVRAPGLLAAACSWMLTNVIGHVTGIWTYREVEFDYYRTYAVVLPVVVLALGITILVPGSDREEVIDLEAHYFSVAPAAFGCIALFQLFGLLADQLPGAQDVPPWWFMLLACWLVSRARVHPKQGRSHRDLDCAVGDDCSIGSNHRVTGVPHNSAEGSCGQHLDPRYLAISHRALRRRPRLGCSGFARAGERIGAAPDQRVTHLAHLSEARQMRSLRAEQRVPFSAQRTRMHRFIGAQDRGPIRWRHAHIPGYWDIGRAASAVPRGRERTKEKK